MSRIRWLRIIALLALTAAVGNCADKDVESYLRGPDGELWKYLDHLSQAVCNLEQHTSGIEKALRTCPDGPGDRKSVPSYPP